MEDLLTSIDRVGSHTLKAMPMCSYDQVKTAPVGRGASAFMMNAEKAKKTQA